jgi:hypothetical protein
VILARMAHAQTQHTAASLGEQTHLGHAHGAKDLKGLAGAGS